MKLVGIVGSTAKRSTNRTLLQYMKKTFAVDASIELVEVEGLPVFEESKERTTPEQIEAVASVIKQADGIIISTAEYDHSIPAALKSLLEWLSYTSRPLINKPVMIVGASHGTLGSSRAQAHLRQILDAPELAARVLPSSEFLLGRSLQAFDDEENLADEKKVAELESSFQEFLHFIVLTKELVSSERTMVKRNQADSWMETMKEESNK